MKIEHCEQTQKEFDALGIDMKAADKIIYALHVSQGNNEVSITFIESVLKSTTVTMSTPWARYLAENILASTTESSTEYQ